MTLETLTGAIGHEHDDRIAERIHALEHRGAVERIYLREKEIGRRRFRATGDRGTEYGVVLEGDPVEIDGLVLALEADRAVILHAGEPDILELEGVTAAGALQLGWHAGHLHWRVRFEEGRLTVLLDGEPEEYLARIHNHLADGSIRVIGQS